MGERKLFITIQEAISKLDYLIDDAKSDGPSRALFQIRALLANLEHEAPPTKWEGHDDDLRCETTEEVDGTWVRCEEEATHHHNDVALCSECHAKVVQKWVADREIVQVSVSDPTPPTDPKPIVDPEPSSEAFSAGPYFDGPRGRERALADFLRGEDSVLDPSDATALARSIVDFEGGE